MQKLKITKPFWQVVGVGTLAGMRTMSAPAIVSHILSHHQSGVIASSPLKFMQSPVTSGVFKLLAVNEMIQDKKAKTPNRTRPLGLIFRCVTGSLAGASIYKATGNNPVVGALIGSASAFGSTFGSFYLRKGTASKTKIFDPLIGALEDALVVGAGVGLVEADDAA